MSTRARSASLLLLGCFYAGCAGPGPAEPVAPAARFAVTRAAGPAAEPVAPAERPVLRLRRVDAEGRPLRLRALVFDRRGQEQVAALVGTPPGPVSLPPGRYRVRVLAEPGPFGFHVDLAPGRPVEVLVCSDPAARSHAAVVETRREPLGDGVTYVERQVLGFGWGPVPPIPSAGELGERGALGRGEASASATPPEIPSALELEAWRAEQRRRAERAAGGVAPPAP